MIYLILYLTLSLIQKAISLILYPLAYILRDCTRGQQIIADIIYLPNHGISKLLWYILDDSILIENRKVFHNDKEYCYYGKRSIIIEALIPEWFFKDFFRSYYWGAIRNSFINWSRWHAFIKIGHMTSVINHINLGNEKSFYQYREFYFSNRPYLQLWYGTFFLQIGFLSNGRFEAEVKFNKR